MRILLRPFLILIRNLQLWYSPCRNEHQHFNVYMITQRRINEIMEQALWRDCIEVDWWKVSWKLFLITSNGCHFLKCHHLLWWWNNLVEHSPYQLRFYFVRLNHKKKYLKFAFLLLLPYPQLTVDIFWCSLC